MFTFWKQTSEFEKYSETVNHCLRALFLDYPVGTLGHLRVAVDVTKLQRMGFAGKEKAADCAVMIAREMVGIFFVGLSDDQMAETAAAFDARDLGHSLFYALASMDSTAQQITDDVQRRLLLYEAAGRLKGITREEIETGGARRNCSAYSTRSLAKANRRVRSVVSRGSRRCGTYRLRNGCRILSRKKVEAGPSEFRIALDRGTVLECRGGLIS